MFVDPNAPVPAAELAPHRTPRRTDADRLRDALIALAGGHGTVTQHGEKPWASVTFIGARHSVSMEFTGDTAVAGGEWLIAKLADHEFALPRQLVAEAVITAAEHALLPAPTLRVECELLLIEDR